MDAWEASLREQSQRATMMRQQLELQSQRAEEYRRQAALLGLYHGMQNQQRQEEREPVRRCRLEECSKGRARGSWYCEEHEGNLRSWL